MERFSPLSLPLAPGWLIKAHIRNFMLPSGITHAISLVLCDQRVQHTTKAFGERSDCQREGVLTSYKEKKEG